MDLTRVISLEETEDRCDRTAEIRTMKRQRAVAPKKKNVQQMNDRALVKGGSLVES